MKTSFLEVSLTEADIEELTYLLQHQLIKDQVALNKENTIKYFINHLH